MGLCVLKFHNFIKKIERRKEINNYHKKGRILPGLGIVAFCSTKPSSNEILVFKTGSFRFDNGSLLTIFTRNTIGRAIRKAANTFENFLNLNFFRKICLSPWCDGNTLKVFGCIGKELDYQIK